MDTISGFWKNFICFRFRFSKRVTECQFLFPEVWNVWYFNCLGLDFWDFCFHTWLLSPPGHEGHQFSKFHPFGNPFICLLSRRRTGGDIKPKLLRSLILDTQGDIMLVHNILPLDREITGSSSPDMLHSVVCWIVRPLTDLVTSTGWRCNVFSSLLSTQPWDVNVMYWWCL